MEKPYDYVILGGGIVGISTAWQLKQRYPTARVLVLEKESEVSMHQTGHNSGVIHAGVYYQPGSLKAQFCREGVEKTISFCEKHDIPYDQCGKLLVSTNQTEYERMQALYERCAQMELKQSCLMKLNCENESRILPATALFTSNRLPLLTIVWSRRKWRKSLKPVGAN